MIYKINNCENRLGMRDFWLNDQQMRRKRKQQFEKMKKKHFKSCIYDDRGYFNVYDTHWLRVQLRKAIQREKWFI